MGLLVWLMHCDLLGLAVYLFPSTEREREKRVECFLKGKQKQEWAIKGSALKEGRKPVFRNKLTVKNEVNEDKLTEIVHPFAKSSKKENRSCECRVPVQLRARSRLLYSTAAERRPKQPGIVKIDGCRVYPDWGRQSQLWNQTCSLQINVSAPKLCDRDLQPVCGIMKPFQVGLWCSSVTKSGAKTDLESGRASPARGFGFIQLQLSEHIFRI